MTLTEKQRILVEQNHNLIYGIINKHSLDETEFYDVLAIGLCKAACTYNPNKSKFATYAYKVMYNEYLMQLRKESKNPHPQTVNIEEPLVDDGGLTWEDFIPDPENCIKRFEDREFIRHLAKQISPTMQKAVELRLQGIPYQEIAKQLGVASSYCGAMPTRLRKLL